MKPKPIKYQNSILWFHKVKMVGRENKLMSLMQSTYTQEQWHKMTLKIKEGKMLALIYYILIYCFNCTLMFPGSSFLGQLSFLKVKCQLLLQKVYPTSSSHVKVWQSYKWWSRNMAEIRFQGQMWTLWHNMWHIGNMCYMGLCSLNNKMTNKCTQCCHDTNLKK